MKKNNLEKKDSFKLSVLDAAENIILEEGYQKLSARKISSRIGCAVGSLYNAYENLNDIFLRINQRTLKRLHNQFKEYSRNNSAAPSESLLGLGNIYMRFWESEYQLANLLFNYTQPKEKPLPEWAQNDVDAVFFTIIEMIEPVKESLSEEPETIVSVLWAGLHGIANLCFSGKMEVVSSETPLFLTRSFIQSYFRGAIKTQVSEKQYALARTKRITEVYN